jgi:hypothetical protein
MSNVDVLAIRVLLNGWAYGISNVVPKLEVQVNQLDKKAKRITELDSQLMLYHRL